MGLPLSRHARRDIDSSIRLDAHLGPLVRADSRALNIAGHPYAQIAPPLACPSLLFTKLFVSQSLFKALQASLVVAAIVDRWPAVLIDQADIPGELFGPNKVTAAHLQWIKA